MDKAILIGIINKQQDEQMVREYLDELSFLAETAGLIPIKKIVQRLDAPHPKTFVGSGKLQEIKDFAETDEDITVAVFDDELSASQLRNVEHFLKDLWILDRTNLILDIFARRAKTAHARVQVELAQYQYLLPRLKRMWTHLERQKGGIGLRGPGETQIETDRRIVLDKIAKLKEQLKKIDRQMESQRGNRGKMVRVALVGYTNVGKSTLMNVLSKSDVFAENKLFATLDTTVRKVIIGNLPFLLSDTVGFIRKLPHGLIESFKSTLDETREADVLLHVVDISHPNFEEHIAVVNETLQDIGVTEKEMIMIFNKIDAYRHTPKDPHDLSPETRENIPLEHWEKSWMGKQNRPSIFISAKEKTNFPEMRKLLYEKIRDIHTSRYPYDDFLFEYYE